VHKASVRLRGNLDGTRRKTDDFVFLDTRLWITNYFRHANASIFSTGFFLQQIQIFLMTWSAAFTAACALVSTDFASEAAALATFLAVP
jgi:hypothetical protein